MMSRPDHATVPNPPGIPLVVYDGNCGFCKVFVERWRAALAPRVEFTPFQDSAKRFPTLPLERFQRAVQLIEPDGTVYQGAEAVVRILAKKGRRGRAPLWLYRHVPGARPLAELGYRWVADHRSLLYPVTRRLLGRHREIGPGRQRSRWLPLGLGLTALALGAAVLAWRRRR